MSGFDIKFSKTPTVEEVDAFLRREEERIERLACEAACTQLERMLDAEGRPPTLTQEQRDLIAGAAKTAVARQRMGVLLALIPRSDDEIRSSMVDKLEGICRKLLEVTR